MKTYLQKIINGMLWGLGAFFIFWVGSLMINADWSSSKTTTDATPAGSLYSTAGTALTAQKWNEAMSKVNKDYPQESLVAGQAGTEQDTGTKRIDGKTIYRKLVRFGLGATTSSKSVAHGISNLNYVVNYRLFGKEDIGRFWVINNNSANTGDWGYFYINATNITQGCQSAGNRSTTDLYVLIEYTKS